MLEWVDPKTTPKRVKPFSVSSKKFYIKNNDRTDHFVGHSQLKELDIVDFYKRKQTNENMEAGMKEIDVKLGKNAYSEDDNFDEAIFPCFTSISFISASIFSFVCFLL